jgi:hypothetical protein
MPLVACELAEAAVRAAAISCPVHYRRDSQRIAQLYSLSSIVDSHDKLFVLLSGGYLVRDV